MLVTTLIIVGLLALLFVFGVVFLQHLRISRGQVAVEEGYSGHEQVSVTLHIIIRYLIKRSIHFRKFATQYVLHVFVRIMFYLDKGFSLLYAKSRNMFVSSAVKNRGTVPHFWEHLKVYKQEMDKEKEEE